jgi:DNA polymerase I-like protein with 3'-5' exonuclease and polymerase domains
MALSYLDYKSEEFAVAAYLSGDREMIDAFRSGDPYVGYAIKAGLVPVGATKATHKDVRDRCKRAVLGLSYGMGDKSLAKYLGVPLDEARHLLRSHQEVFHQYHEWVKESVQQALLTGSQQTSYGWFHHCGGGRTSLRTIQNWPIQSAGSDILRLACIMLENEGIRVISTIHDAVLIEDTVDDIDNTAEMAMEQMELASSYVLRGAGSIQVDAKTVKFPDHYSDPRGDRMWERVQRILKDLDAVPHGQ